jgi:hypothetical protein
MRPRSYTHKITTTLFLRGSGKMIKKTFLKPSFHKLLEPHLILKFCLLTVIRSVDFFTTNTQYHTKRLVTVVSKASPL